MTADPKKANPASKKNTKPVEEKLRDLARLQYVDSEIDKIKTLRGELPLVVQDLKDEIEGLETRVSKYQDEIKELQKQVSGKKIKIKDAEAMIKKYKDQQLKVRNSREFDALEKEIEYQELDIQLSEKRIGEYSQELKEKKQAIDESQKAMDERNNDLEVKQEELERIIAETQEREEKLRQISDGFEELIEPRLFNAYRRIRANARNGLAVVSVKRNACGGCFNKIPPQRQLDIRSRKKIIVCEYCGRILVDTEIEQEEKERVEL